MKIYHQLSDNQLFALNILENAFFAAWGYLGSCFAPLYARGSVQSMKTGVASFDLNMAWNNQPLREKDLPAVQTIKADFGQAGLPFSWWVFPRGQGRLTCDLLEAEGFSLKETLPCLLADLTRPFASSDTCSCLSIMRARHQKHLALWEAVSFQAFEFTEDNREQYRRFLGFLDLSESAPLILLLAFLNGKPVGTALLFLQKETAGIYFVSTLAKYRRRGIGLAITLAALTAARQAGCRYACLQSSPDGLSVYRRAGFQEYCLVHVYVLNSAK